MSAPNHSEEFLYRTIFDFAGDAMFVCSEKGLIVECNQAAMDLFACTRDDFIGSSAPDWSPEFQPNGRPSAEMAAEIFARVYAEGMARFNWMNQRSDGLPLWVEGTVRLAKIVDKVLFIVISREIYDLEKTAPTKLDIPQAFNQLATSKPKVLDRCNTTEHEPVVFSNFAATRRLLRLVSGDAYVDAPDIADRLAEEEERLINDLAKKVGDLRNTVFKLEILMKRLKNQEYDENYSGWLDLHLLEGAISDLDRFISES